MWQESFIEKHALGVEMLNGTKGLIYSNEQMVETEDGVQYTYDVEEIDYTERPSTTPVSQAKAAKLKEIADYDSSMAVNSFYYGGIQMWIPKELRISLMNSSTIEAKAGNENTALWFNGVKFELTIASLQQMLSTIELYALQCYNVTEAHKAAVMSMYDDESINSYDYTAGYPEKLHF